MEGQGTPLDGSFPPLDRSFLPRGFTSASSLVDVLRSTTTNVDERPAGSGSAASGEVMMSPNSKAIAQAEQELKKSKSKGRMLQLQQEIQKSEAENARLSEGVFRTGWTAGCLLLYSIV